MQTDRPVQGNPETVLASSAGSTAIFGWLDLTTVCLIQLGFLELPPNHNS